MITNVLLPSMKDVAQKKNFCQSSILSRNSVITNSSAVIMY